MHKADLLWRHQQLHLSQLLQSRRGYWLLAWLLGQVTALAGIGLLALSGWFITAAGVAGVLNLTTAFTFNYLWPSGIIRLLAISRTAGRYGERLTSHQAVLALLADLRSSLFARLAQKSTTQTASITQMHRLISDIELLNNWPLNLVLPLGWMLISLLIFLTLLILSLGITHALIISSPLIIASIILPFVVSYHSRQWGQQQTNRAEQRRQALLQPLSALTALLQWQQWPHFAANFFQQDQHYLQAANWQQRYSARIVWLQHLCLAISAALLLSIAASQLVSRQLTIAWLMALLLTLISLTDLITAIGQQTITYSLCRAACQRLNALLPSPSCHTPTSPKATLPAQIHLQAHNISIRYPSALSGVTNLSFNINSGQILLIEGASGVGKSTLMAALAGELPIQKGYLTCQQQPLSHWQWQGQLAYLAQQLDIFDLSLAENLRLGKAQASDHELWHVLSQVALADWVKAQPQQLATPLGEYGCAISGGQARRIALARLLLKPYALMLLDEPFAGLDNYTAQHIAHTLLQQQQQRILILTSHQPLTAIESARPQRLILT